MPSFVTPSPKDNSLYTSQPTLTLQHRPRLTGSSVGFQLKWLTILCPSGRIFACLVNVSTMALRLRIISSSVMAAPPAIPSAWDAVHLAVQFAKWDFNWDFQSVAELSVDAFAS